MLSGRTKAEVRSGAVQFIGLSILIGMVLTAMRWMQLSGMESLTGSQRVITVPGAVVLELLWVGVYLVSMGFIGLTKPNALWCTRITLGVVLIEGIIVMIRWSLGFDPGPGGNMLAGVLIVVTLGSSLMPWTPKQMLGLAGLWVLGSTSTLLLVGPDPGMTVGASIIGYCFAVIPGIMVSFFRTTRLQDKFEIDYFQTRYERIEQELSAAKNIHERAFPVPRTTGSVRFAYSYRPMSQIGGDYLYASIHDDSIDSPVLLLLLDVSGHGIPAALTVNRLQGELMQIIGENPDIAPADALSALDRYIAVTNPDVPVLVTGIAARVDPVKDELVIANAGHPSAIIRDKSGNMTEVEATGPLMGIDPDAELSWEERRFDFYAGDAVIAFTDGITEATNSQSEMYGVEGVRGVIQTGWIDQGQRWTELVRRSVDRYCEGVVNDDMLIVEIYRPLGT